MPGTFPAALGQLAPLRVVANWVPDPSPSFGSSPTPFVVLMLLGFLVAVAGHITRTRFLIILGIGMIFLATAVLPYATYLSKS